jgi:hypothetical protein
MDSLGTTRSKAVRRLVCAAGAKLFFLPRYSPYLNPIDRFLPNFETLLRKTLSGTCTAAVYPPGEVFGKSPCLTGCFKLDGNDNCLVATGLARKRGRVETVLIQPIPHCHHVF